MLFFATSSYEVSHAIAPQTSYEQARIILQDPQKLLHLSPDVVSVERLGSPLADKVASSSLSSTSEAKKTLNESEWYRVFERTSILFNTTFYASFEKKNDGISCHVFAPLGVELVEDYTLATSGLGDKLELVENVTIRCPSLCMRYVKATTQAGHGKMREELVAQLKNITDST